VKKTRGPRVRLVHWNPAEAEARAAPLCAAGYDVVSGPMNDVYLRGLRADPPDAVVIDMTRIPSHGRDIGLAIRQYKQTRHVPLLFVEGDPEKIALVRQLLPDATYCSWRGIRGALRRALSRPAPKEPVVPASVMAGYSGTPLPKKLGIKAGMSILLVDPPEDVERVLGPLPEQVKLVRRLGSGAGLILWFVRSRRDLERRIPAFVASVGPDGIWICWPKKTSALAGDLGQPEVRAAGLGAGIVDYKVCAIDGTWSGLKFALRGKVKRKAH
jgi:hypothetical protein